MTEQLHYVPQALDLLAAAAIRRAHRDAIGRTDNIDVEKGEPNPVIEARWWMEHYGRDWAAILMPQRRRLARRGRRGVRV